MGASAAADLHGLEWPSDGLLRRVAELTEESGMFAEVLDDRWRVVFASLEQRQFMETAFETADLSPYFGVSYMARAAQWPALFAVTEESDLRFLDVVAPQVLNDVPPGSPEFDEIWAMAAPLAEAIDPAPRFPFMSYRMDFVSGPAKRATERGGWTSTEMLFNLQRLYDEEARFRGLLATYQPVMDATLSLSLMRGDASAHSLMLSLAEPQKRPAAILFADLEASGPLSRRMSSLAYFKLVRDLRDLIDTAVTEGGGLLGKHAGDGASALFVAAEGGAASESEVARRAIVAARAIREGAGALGGDSEQVRVNIGLHWGATLTIGQISTSGRLEVTGMGDEMNECARIETAASEGALLASKDLLERLSSSDAELAGVDPEAVPYVQLAELVPDGKVARDAGQIPVARL